MVDRALIEDISQRAVRMVFQDEATDAGFASKPASFGDDMRWARNDVWMVGQRKKRFELMVERFQVICQ